MTGFISTVMGHFWVSRCLLSNIFIAHLRLSDYLSTAPTKNEHRKSARFSKENLQGLGAVVGAISRNLSDLQERQGSYLYIYDHPTLPIQVLFIIGNKRCLQHHSRWLGDASKAELEKLFSETSFEVLVLSGVAAAGECKSMLPSRETSADTETGDVKAAGKMCGCT
ncbi:hypothetical protein POM88_029632 [Heracleum sosnowskyi]|uniref:Uncharacterized protein n=1 Tax=Heracleum sosnowskyi TaxID=360622 RepID=A0AAD8HV91_9APIA|nr:hypothetical protein POM88_029632 [Heracleum sosnowskyi]